MSHYKISAANRFLIADRLALLVGDTTSAVDCSYCVLSSCTMRSYVAEGTGVVLDYLHLT